MSSEPVAKKRKYTSSSSDTEVIELFAELDVSETETESETSIATYKCEATQPTSNAAFPCQVKFSLEEANQRTWSEAKVIRDNAETLAEAENCFLDGLARAEDSESRPFREFLDLFSTLDTQDLKLYCRKNKDRTYRLLQLSRIASGVDTVGSYQLTARHSRDWHANPDWRHRDCYEGESTEQE